MALKNTSNNYLTIGKVVFSKNDNLSVGIQINAFESEEVYTNPKTFSSAKKDPQELVLSSEDYNTMVTILYNTLKNSENVSNLDNELFSEMEDI